ncbi:MAG: bifunctional adenosylcobinamide kinase/adenosylcobinamide-phosphate guanylyltransferase [Lachnospiraceae bacterium]|nr:bifunctional adenosylcobinamide kinase/adenosylcobinamide-phosphate guanylyltransferase [Lachnospiraceae bacterium]
MIITVIGGNASGKSELAEDMLERLAEDEKKYYIATMKVGNDEENMERVKKHRLSRKDKNFVTIEKCVDVNKALEEMDADSIKHALLECVSNLVANEMFFDVSVRDKDETTKKVISDIGKLSDKTDNLVIVSNNVFEGGNAYDVYTLNYLEALAKVNAHLSEISDEVYESVVGIPVRIK